MNYNGKPYILAVFIDSQGGLVVKHRVRVPFSTLVRVAYGLGYTSTVKLG